MFAVRSTSPILDLASSRSEYVWESTLDRRIECGESRCAKEEDAIHNFDYI